MTASHRSCPSPVRWLLGVVLVAGCLLADVLGPWTVSAARAATADASHRIPGTAIAAETSSPALASLRAGVRNARLWLVEHGREDLAELSVSPLFDAATAVRAGAGPRTAELLGRR